MPVAQPRHTPGAASASQSTKCLEHAMQQSPMQAMTMLARHQGQTFRSSGVTIHASPSRQASKGRQLGDGVSSGQAWIMHMIRGDGRTVMYTDVLGGL
jgi:hypothetical protein